MFQYLKRAVRLNRARDIHELMYECGEFYAPDTKEMGLELYRECANIITIYNMLYYHSAYVNGSNIDHLDNTVVVSNREFDFNSEGIPTATKVKLEIGTLLIAHNESIGDKNSISTYVKDNIIKIGDCYSFTDSTGYMFSSEVCVSSLHVEHSTGKCSSVIAGSENDIRKVFTHASQNTVLRFYEDPFNPHSITMKIIGVMSTYNGLSDEQKKDVVCHFVDCNGTRALIPGFLSDDWNFIKGVFISFCKCFENQGVKYDPVNDQFMFTAVSESPIDYAKAISKLSNVSSTERETLQSRATRALEPEERETFNAWVKLSTGGV